jgi:hypothetical protein
VLLDVYCSENPWIKEHSDGIRKNRKIIQRSS